jgi:hypothetical protein
MEDERGEDDQGKTSITRQRPANIKNRNAIPRQQPATIDEFLEAVFSTWLLPLTSQYSSKIVEKQQGSYC